MGSKTNRQLREYGNNRLIEHEFSFSFFFPFINKIHIFLTLYKLQIRSHPTIATQDTMSTRIRGSSKEGQ